MSRFTFAALASVVLSAPAAAQAVPARDLFEFPIGGLADAPALSTRMPASLWNPAVRASGPTDRADIGFAALTTPQNQGVQLEMIGAEYRLRPRLSAAVSFAQASVNDIIRTETDPQSIGGEIPYGTSVFSAGLAATDRRTPLGTWSAGLAARYRWATVDAEHAASLSLDGGVVLDRIAGTPFRGALSTFLFTPARSRDDATYMAAIDLPVFRRDSTLTVRGGYAYSGTRSRGRDDYVFASADHAWFSANAGFDWSSVFGDIERRLRLGFALRYASYGVAVSREDGNGGIGANYQFALTRTIP